MYVDVRETTLEFDDESMEEIKRNRTQLVPCTAENFRGSEFQRNYFDVQVK